MSGRPSCPGACRQILIDGMAAMDIEVHVSSLPPLFPTGYEPLNLRCPHGVFWYMEPTAEQRLRFAAEGTP